MPSWWAHLAEVPLAQPVERSTVKLRGPADEVVHLRLELLTVPVAPAVLRDVAVVDEDRARIPVLLLLRQPIAALEQEDALAGGGEPVREGTAAGTRADDHDVVA